MQVADGIAIVLVLAAAVAFWLGNAALARSEDIKALYWLIVGIVAVRASIQIGRAGAKA